MTRNVDNIWGRNYLIPLKHLFFSWPTPTFSSKFGAKSCPSKVVLHPEKTMRFYCAISHVYWRDRGYPQLRPNTNMYYMVIEVCFARKIMYGLLKNHHSVLAAKYSWLVWSLINFEWARGSHQHHTWPLFLNLCVVGWEYYT